MSPDFLKTFLDSSLKQPIEYILKCKNIRKSKERSAYTPSGNHKADRATKQINSLDTVGKDIIYRHS